MKKKTNVKMTPEILAKLRGIGVVTGQMEYIHKIDDVPEEFWPVFKIKSFTVEDSKKLKIRSTNGEDVEEILEDSLRQHIVGWTNLYDLSTGEEFEFEASADGGALKDKYESLPTGLRMQLLTFISSLTGSV
jgi:hypothetical protein